MVHFQKSRIPKKCCRKAPRHIKGGKKSYLGKAPRDAYYSSYVTVVVRDETMFGTEIVASRDIPLAPYASNSMYDSANKYRSRAHITDAVRLKQFWHMGIKDKDVEDGDFRNAERSQLDLKVDFKNDAEEKGGADDEEEEEEEEIEIAEIVPCINLDPDCINMVFDTELTDYHLEGEVSGDEESSSDDSDGEKEEAVFWPGDFNQEDENLGRQHFDTCLEDQNSVLDPIYST